MTLSPRVIFRADGGPKIGGGHVSRCLALAEALHNAGWETIFAVEAPALPFLRSHPLGRKYIELPDAKPLTLAAAAGGRVDMLFVDHYGLGAEFEMASRAFADRIVAFDDLPTRSHDVDVLIDYTAGRTAAAYADLVGPGTRILAGSRYVPLKSAFAQARPAALARRAARGPVQRLLVSLGAGDALDTLRIALEGVAQLPPDLEVDLVAGGAADINALTALLARFERHYGLHIGVRDLSALMTSADIALGAVGVTAWERCGMGLPTVLIQIADNQRDSIVSLEEAGAGIALGSTETITPEMVAKALGHLIADDQARRSMSRAAAALCDGLGASRIALALPPVGAEIALRSATVADEALLLAWQNEPATRRFSRTPGVPTPQEHKAWLKRTLDDQSRLLCVVLSKDVPVGMLRLDRSDDETGFEVSIVISEANSGRGLARGALAVASRMFPWAELRAEVLPGNDRSHALFRAAGYRLDSDGLYRLPASLAA